MASAVVSHAAGALTNVLSTAAAVTHLGKLNGALGFLSPTLLLAGHCAAVASMMKGRYSSPLLGLLQGLLFAYGGSILSSALLGSPTGNVLYADNKVSSAASLSCQSKQNTANQPTNHSPATTEMNHSPTP